MGDMVPFLSEIGLTRHKEYVEALRRRLQFLYVSYEGLRDIDNKRLARSRGRCREAAREVLSIRGEMLLHEVYFSSFSKREYPSSEAAKLCFGSTLTLLNELKTLALKKNVSFVGVCKNGVSYKLFSVNEPCEIFTLGEPILAIDLEEHAYFLEFGFNKEAYLGRALAYLNLALLDENK